MLHIVGESRITESFTIIKDEWLLPSNCTESIHTYLIGVPESTKSECSNYYQLVAENDRDWLPIRKRSGNIIDKRNGRPCINFGDKFYKTVEFSPDFFKNGAPVSPPVFGFGVKKVDTFIPISKDVVHKTRFADKIKQNELDADINAVIELDKWRPAPTLKYTKLPI